jgi:hypothetical protein
MKEKMNNVVDVRVLDEEIIMKIPRANIVQEIDNVASFDSKTRKLINTGVKQEEFQKNYLGKWKKYKDHLEFAPIFTFQSFNPNAAGMFLWGWLDAMISQVAGNIVFRFQTKLELSISFVHYENIPLEKQQEFEYLVFRYLYARKLTINGKEKNWDKRNRFPAQFLIVLNFSFMMIFLFLSIIPIAFLTSWFSVNNFPPLLDFILFVVGLLGLLTGFVYLGNSISILLWALCLKPFIPRNILWRTLEYQYNMPIKRNMDNLTKLLAEWILMGKR